MVEVPDEAVAETATESAQLTADVVLLATGPRGLPHVLLIRRRWDPFEGRWALPGGYVDPGEHTHDAAARELAEETGVRVSITPRDLTGVYADPGRDPRGRFVTFVYSVRFAGPLEQVTAGDDAAQARWWPLDVALQTGHGRLAFDHHRILVNAAALAGARL
jgi:8-oxo-dGTP diphosphatase